VWLADLLRWGEHSHFQEDLDALPPLTYDFGAGPFRLGPSDDVENMKRQLGDGILRGAAAACSAWDRLARPYTCLLDAALSSRWLSFHCDGAAWQVWWEFPPLAALSDEEREELFSAADRLSEELDAWQIAGDGTRVADEFDAWTYPVVCDDHQPRGQLVRPAPAAPPLFGEVVDRLRQVRTDPQRWGAAGPSWFMWDSLGVPREGPPCWRMHSSWSRSYASPDGIEAFVRDWSSPAFVDG
jgi:hypothetical protein